MENYGCAKANIFVNQDEKGYCIINGDDEMCRTLAKKCKARVMQFSSTRQLKEGAFVKERDSFVMTPATEVETIDTTGAGDVFCGAVSVYLSEGHSLIESVRFANAAAAIAVTRMGAQSAIPYRSEVRVE